MPTRQPAEFPNLVPIARNELWPRTPPASLEKTADGAQCLDALRAIAMSCRAKPREDLFRACALLQTSRSASAEAHAEALARCLPQALGQPVRFLAPGCSEQTFDEAWLVQLGRAIASDDVPSQNFLLGSRVVAEHRRLTKFLVGRVWAYFDTDLELF